MIKRLVLVTALLLTTSCATFQPRAVTLFDSFTQMRANVTLPGDAGIILGDSHAAYFQRLVDISPEPVIVYPPDDGTFSDFWGMNTGEVIFINGGLSPNAQVATLAHEMGHYMQPQDLNRMAGETDYFAEAVSNIFCRRIGLDVSWSSIGYLSNQLDTFLPFVLKHAVEIDDAVEQLWVGVGKRKMH